LPRTLAIVLLLAGCSAADFEAAPSSSTLGAGPAVDGACIRSGVQHVPTEASCYRVTSQGTPLANCYGDETTHATNEEQTPRDKGYIVTAFDLEPGDCFYFYACRGEATFDEAAPVVEVCP
jgi:hypothetical protein